MRERWGVKTPPLPNINPKIERPLERAASFCLRDRLFSEWWTCIRGILILYNLYRHQIKEEYYSEGRRLLWGKYLAI